MIYFIAIYFMLLPFVRLFCNVNNSLFSISTIYFIVLRGGGLEGEAWFVGVGSVQLQLGCIDTNKLFFLKNKNTKNLYAKSYTNTALPE